MDSLNLLIVTAWSPTLEAGGVSTVIRILRKGLSENHRTHVLVNDWGSPVLSPATGSNEGISLLRLRSPFAKARPLIGFLGWLRDLPRTVIQLKRLIADRRIDVVHLHYAASYQFYFRLLRPFGGPPYIVTLHGSDAATFAQQSRIDRALTRWMLNGAAAVTAVSAPLGATARETYGCAKAIQVVENGIDIADIETAAETARAAVPALPFASTSPYLLCVANVTPVKGVDLAIRAWAWVKEALPDLHLVIAGERRDHWETCQRLLDEQNCRDRVHLLGAQPHRTVLSLLRSAAALLCPSRREGLPMVVLEAGVLRRPVVCTRIEALTAIVRHGESAIMAPPEDPEALAQAVIRLVKDVRLQSTIADALHERVTRDFSSTRMVDCYLTLYRQALAAGAGT